MTKLYSVVVIGASAGALDALTVILPALPQNYALPILIVVHVSPDKKSLMSELFTARCALICKEAEDKETLCAGHVYFAPPDYHLLAEANGTVSLSSDEPVWHSRPSIDVLFETAADAYGRGVLAVILTGANNDGAGGMRKIVDAGGRGLVQEPENAHARAMPQAAIKLCPEAQTLGLHEIAVQLVKAGDLS